MTAWNERFLSGHYPWDIRRPSPLITRLVSELLTPPCRVIVVGCGQGWEVDQLIARGFDVTAFDIAPAALELISDRLGSHSNLTLIAGDILDIRKSLHEQFDCVIEHNCFCSIEPEMRSQYVAGVAALTKPQGRFVGAFLNFENQVSTGPPYGSDIPVVQSLFESHFEIERLQQAPELFPPPDIDLPSQVYRVFQLEGVFKRHSCDG